MNESTEAKLETRKGPSWFWAIWAAVVGAFLALAGTARPAKGPKRIPRVRKGRPRRWDGFWGKIVYGFAEGIAAGVGTTLVGYAAGFLILGGARELEDFLRSFSPAWARALNLSVPLDEEEQQIDSNNLRLAVKPKASLDASPLPDLELRYLRKDLPAITLIGLKDYPMPGTVDLEYPQMNCKVQLQLSLLSTTTLTENGAKLQSMLNLHIFADSLDPKKAPCPILDR